MNDAILIKLLRLNFENKKKVESFDSSKIDFGYFYIDLLSVVLDALEVPQDNSVAQEDKYGDKWAEHPDTFCRDWFWNKWDEIVVEGTDEEFREYIKVVRDAINPEQPLTAISVM